jgi:hypothetical protein
MHNIKFRGSFKQGAAGLICLVAKNRRKELVSSRLCFSLSHKKESRAMGVPSILYFNTL